MLKNFLGPLKDVMLFSTTSMASFNYSQFHLPLLAKQLLLVFVGLAFLDCLDGMFSLS
jgi:hypothetical protein